MIHDLFPTLFLKKAQACTRPRAPLVRIPECNDDEDRRSGEPGEVHIYAQKEAYTSSRPLSVSNRIPNTSPEGRRQRRHTPDAMWFRTYQPHEDDYKTFLWLSGIA